MQAVRVLIVDDEEDNREVLARRFRLRGFETLTADSGERALELLHSDDVDLVVLDVMMPGLSGLDVLDTMRKDRHTSTLPVIMATAKTDSNDIVDALERGANDYVTKPIDFDVLLARVNATMRARPSTPPPTKRRAMGRQELSADVVVAGRYKIKDKLGAGAYGTVYRARHLELQQDVALKVLKAGPEQDEAAIQRFRREGVAACRVKHPNAVSVMDFVVTPDGLAILVMELLSGHTLRQEMKWVRRYDPSRAASVGVGVCLALAEAHKNGIVHRDIKPSNIFLQEASSGQLPKVLDFGIAKVFDQAAQSSADADPETTLTAEGALVGTPAYMAPERFRGIPYDGQSDVYSLGITLYEMLSGQRPFHVDSGDAISLGMKHVGQAPAPLASLVAGVPPELDSLILLMLAKDPSLRPTAAQLALQLSQCPGITIPSLPVEQEGPFAGYSLVGPSPANDAKGPESTEKTVLVGSTTNVVPSSQVVRSTNSDHTDLPDTPQLATTLVVGTAGPSKKPSSDR